MPFLSNNYVYEITNPEETSTLTIDTVTTNSVETTTNYTILTNQSKKFYNDFINLLNQTDIDFTSNEDDYSFTIFGLTFYLFVKRRSTSEYVFVPLIQRKHGRELGELRFIGRSSTNYGNTATGFENSSSITDATATEINILKYGIELCYNSNFIHATYISYTGVKHPLCTIIKGQTIDGTDVVYTSGCINTYDQYNNSDRGQLHHVVLPSNPIQTIPPQSASDSYNYSSNFVYNSSHISNSNYNYNGVFDRDCNNTITYLQLLKPDIKESFILKKATAFGRLVSFDNLFNTTINTISSNIPNKFSIDHFYKINGETYYCPGNYISQNVNIITDTSNTSSTDRFLLKL